MQTIRLAAVQMNAPLGQIEENVAKIESYARQAAREGAELVLFPELCITGHWCDGKVWSAAEAVPAGESVRRLETLARERKVFISAGLAEKENNLVYNTQVIVGPEGYLGKARKVHMSVDEYFYYRGGNDFPVIDIGKCRLGVAICFDNMFPEVSRILAVKGAEVILMPHAARTFRKWTTRRQERIVRELKAEWSKVYAARAYDNGTYCVVVNQAGPAGNDTNHAGTILIFDPGGELIAESKSKTIAEEMVICDLEAEKFSKRREGRCFNLLVRRPEAYGELARGY